MRFLIFFNFLTTTNLFTFIPILSLIAVGMVQWVCFDWGDTLVDIRGTHEEMQRDQGVFNTLQNFDVKVSTTEFDAAYNDLSREFSITLRGNVKRWQKGFFFHELCNRLNFPITEEQAARMSDYFNNQFISKLKLLPGALEVVQFLVKKKVRLALISNANGERVRQQMEFFGLYNYFSIIIISDELGFEKASVEPFKKFLQHAKIIYPVTVPSECLMIGDRADEDGYAKPTGMKTIIIKKKHRFPSANDVDADWEVNDLFELKTLLEKLL